MFLEKPLPSQLAALLYRVAMYTQCYRLPRLAQQRLGPFEVHEMAALLSGVDQVAQSACRHRCERDDDRPSENMHSCQRTVW